MSYFGYVGRLLSNVKGFYNEINSATLTGSIDVVIVQQEDGSYMCSPFHVRFGKLGVLRSREKVVDIEINGEHVDLHMKLGDAGEAFFVKEIDEIQEIPPDLATSPIPSAEDLMEMGVQELHREAERQSQREAQLAQIVEEGKTPTNDDMALDDEPSTSTNQQTSTKKNKLMTKTRTRGDSRLDSDNSSKDSSREMTPSSKNISKTAASEENTKSKRRRKKKTPHKKSNPRLAGKTESKESKMTKSDNTEDIFALEVTSDEEELCAPPSLPSIVKSASLPLAEEDRMDRTNIWANSQFEAHLHPFSDTDITPASSPSVTRCTSPVCKSDTECERQRQEDADPENLLPPPDTTWEWGQLPKPLPSPTTEASTSGETDLGAGHLADPSTKNQASGGLFYFMRKTKTIRHKPEEEGIYLADLTKEEMDPEIAKLYFPKSSHFMSIRDKEDDVESGRGASLPQSPHSVEGAIGGPPASYLMSEVRHLGEVSLSLCGGLADVDGTISMESFMQSVVTFDTLCENLTLIHSPDLVVRIGDKFFNWATAAPQILSLVAFHKYLPESSIQNLVKENMPKKKGKKGGVTSWFSWRRAPPDAIETTTTDALTIATTTTASAGALSSESVPVATVTSMLTTSASADDAKAKTAVSVSVMGSSASENSEPHVVNIETTVVANSVVVQSIVTPPVVMPATEKVNVSVKVEKEIDVVVDTATEEPIAPVTGIIETPCSSAPSSPKKSPGHHTVDRLKSEDSSENETDSSDKSHTEIQSISSESADISHKKYQKSLRLSSAEIMKLNLHEGQNEITFSVTTQYQGTSRCTSHIYLWRYDDRIVISDIDGTITKSDVLGQILPILGRDWSQSGVAQLYTKINSNGYKFIYLSARAIGQSKVTKDLLRNIRQDNLVLPEGPLMLSPISLIRAFHREVIEKKPEEFKIRCMSDIAQLFPLNQRPFYAGFGNKINDVYAYKALDIPFSRIFTINHRGELRHEKILTFQSSYQKLVDVVDHFFPPLQRKVFGQTVLHSESVVPNEFRSISYWREPLPEINPDDLVEVKVIETKVRSGSNVKVTETKVRSGSKVNETPS